jgi:transposase
MWVKGLNTCFPNVLHCHDPFHCVGYLNRAVDKCRKREVKQHNDLRKTKYLWLKDQMNLTHIQYDKFQSIRNCNYEVSRAWRVKENFRDILFRQSQAGAVTVFHIWKHDAKNENIKEINDVVDMFDRHQSGIINAIKTGTNNARAERLNGAIQELKIIGRRYANTDNFRLAILFSLVILTCFHTIPRRTINYNIAEVSIY